MAERTPRELESREKAERPKMWRPPELLPNPNPEPGYAFRWIRLSTLNNPDPMNISSKFREGWEPAKASEHPEVQLMNVVIVWQPAAGIRGHEQLRYCLFADMLVQAGVS